MAQVPYSAATGYTYGHISGAGTTTIKNKAGMLGIVLIGTIANAGTLTLYDNASAGSGTVISVMTLATATATPYRVEVDLLFVNGLTAVLTGASNDITFLYR